MPAHGFAALEAPLATSQDARRGARDDATTRETLTVASDILRRYAAQKRQLLARRHGGLPPFPEPKREQLPAPPAPSSSAVAMTAANVGTGEWANERLAVAWPSGGAGKPSLSLIPPSISASEPEGELVEENKRLRREVGALRQRLQEAEHARTCAVEDAEGVAAELQQLRRWVSCFQRHVLNTDDGTFSRQQQGTSTSGMLCKLDDFSLPEHLSSMMSECRRYSDLHESYFPPEKGMHAVKREVEVLKQELRLLRSVVDGAVSSGRGSIVPQHAGEMTKQSVVLESAGHLHRRRSDPSSVDSRGGWSTMYGCEELGILQEQVTSLEERLQRARQEEFRVGKQASEAVIAAIAARRELAGLKGLGTSSGTSVTAAESPR